MGWIILILVCVGIYLFVKHQKSSSSATPATTRADQKSQASPSEVSFLTESAEISTTDSSTEVLTQANQLIAAGKVADGVRLYNGLLDRNNSPILEIALHHNRSQAIVDRFELGARNKTSAQLKHRIAMEHVLRDWETIIDLWAEKSASFEQKEHEFWERAFNFVYVNYMPMSMGNMIVIDADGKYEEYEERVPVKWKVGWVRTEDGDVLLVNEKLHPQYKLRKP